MSANKKNTKSKQDEENLESQNVENSVVSNESKEETNKNLVEENESKIQKENKEATNVFEDFEKNLEKKETSKETKVDDKIDQNELTKDGDSNLKNSDNFEDENEIKKEEKSNKIEENIDKNNKDCECKTSDNTKELVCVSKGEEPPEYVKEMLKRRKSRIRFIITIILMIVIGTAFSTVFALNNMRNTNIIKGVKVKDVDLSELSLSESEAKLTEVLNKELEKELTIKYGEDYKITLKPEQIEFKYDIKKAVLDASKVGRTDRIIENNYTILFAYFEGKNVEIKYSYNKELLDKFVEDVNSKLPGLVVEPNYYIEKDKLFINKGKDGIEVNKDKLSVGIIEAILNRNSVEVNSDSFNQVIEMPIDEAKASAIDVQKIHDEVYSEPKDAYFEKDPSKIYPDVDGIDYAITIDEAKAIIDAEDKQEYVIPLKISKAKKSVNDLGTEAFPYLVSQFSTRYDASNRNRSTNLEIAARKINGKVLMPGEVFSFNKVVGKRTVQEGYKDAKIYADGAVVDGLAGGICQISSTLYNAALLANLEIVERRNHSFPTSYVRTGRDATVVYGIIDLQFKNTRTTPIKIEAKVKNGIAEFKIHGMQEAEEYEIRILPQVTATLPFSTKTIPDPTLAPGQQVVDTHGKQGYKVTTRIEKRLNGQVVSNEILSNDTYVPMQTVIRVGPGVPVQ